MAAVLACGRTALLADFSAADLWSLSLLPKGGDAPVQVLTVGGKAVDRPGIHVRQVQRLEPGDRALFDGIPVTSPIRTLLDLAALTGPEQLEEAVARAERERLARRSELVARLARRKGRPGTPALRALLERAGGPALTRSGAEKRFLALVREAQLPPPQTNVHLAGHELDCLWPEHGVAVEVEGYCFHASRPRFESDRRRVARLAAHGIQVIPVTWRQIVEEGTATAVRLGQALLQAELHRRD